MQSVPEVLVPKYSVCILFLLIIAGHALNAQDSNKLLFGIRSGDNEHNGLVYSIREDGTDYRVHKTFGIIEGGSNPEGRLIKVGDEYYGRCTKGAQYNKGVIFKISADRSYSVIHTFTPDLFGSWLLLMTSDNYLYGYSILLKPLATGVIFRIRPDGSDYQEVTTLDMNLIGGQVSSLIEGSDGLIYGISNNGGAKSRGSIFRMNREGTDVQAIYTFDTRSDYYDQRVIEERPNRKLNIIDPVLLGTLSTIDMDGANYQRLHTFVGDGSDGAQPVGPPLELSDGSMIGVAKYGGLYNNGVLYSMQPNGSDYTVLHHFQERVDSKIYLSPSGKVYGFTIGEANKSYSIDPDGSNIVYHSFDEQFFPLSEFIVTDNETFLMSSSSGLNGNGAILEVDPATGTYEQVKVFGDDASNPGSNLLNIEGDQLLGLTTYGGANGGGVIFRIDCSGYNEVFNFPRFRQPVSKLIKGPSDELFGTAIISKDGYGVIYKVNSDGTGYEELASFTAAEGHPTDDLIRGIDGTFYGVCTNDVTGVIYSYHPSTKIFSVIFDFAQWPKTNWSYPGAIRMSSDGETIFGTAYNNFFYDDYTYEVLFSIKTDGSDATVVKEFFTVNEFTRSCPTEFPDGNLWGTAGGAIYSVSKDGASFSYKEVQMGYLTMDYDLIQLADGTFAGTTPKSIFFYSPDKNTFSRHAIIESHAYYTSGLSPLQESYDLEFYAIEPKTVIDVSFDLDATTSSGFPIVFSSSDPTIASVIGNTVTIHRDGVVTITASIEPECYLRSVARKRTLTINKVEAQLQFAELPQKKFGDLPFEISAESMSDNAEYLTSSNPEIASINEKTVSIHHAGNVTITAHVDESDRYLSAAVAQELVIEKAEDDITFNALDPKTFGDPNFLLEASSVSGASISFTASDPTIVSIVGIEVSILKSGFTTISAITEESQDHTSTQASQILNVSKLAQIIDFPEIGNKTFGDPPFIIEATASSGLPVEFTAQSARVNVAGSLATIIDPGRETLTAFQSGNVNYKAAESSVTFCVLPPRPSIIRLLGGSDQTLYSEAEFGNQWYRNGIPIPGATLDYLSVEEEGTYTLTVTVDDCSSAFSEEVVIVITGMTEKLKGVFFYPNPATDVLWVNLPKDSLHEFDVRIYNVTGKGILTPFKVEKGKAVIDVSLLAPGHYFAEVTISGKVARSSFTKL